MESLNFDRTELQYYNDDNKISIVNQFKQIEEQLEEYFKKSKLCVIKLHRCDNLNDFNKYCIKYNNNKKTILINLLPLMKEKIAEKIIKSNFKSFHTNIYIAYNGRYVSSNIMKINESFLKLCSDIIKTEEYECNICMKTIIDNSYIVQCSKCKYAVCDKCKMKLKCPICYI
jgi:hypothetical protein